MAKADRRNEIMQMLEESHSVSVEALAGRFGVSDVTIRSDLKGLEQAGLVYRTHGGAVLRDAPAPPHFGEPLAGEAAPLPGAPALETTAALAAGHVQDKSWIFLGSGGTCCAVARALVRREVNVVTNSLAVAGVLAQSASANVMVTGGTLFKNRTPFLYGDQLLATLSNLSFEQAFIGVSGIDLSFGYSISNSVEQGIFQKVKAISHEVVVVADGSKFAKTSFMGIGPLTEANTVVTGGPIPAEYAAHFAQSGINLIAP